MPLTVQSFVVSPFAENTYVLSSGGEAAIVDPGTASRAERQAVEAYLEAAGLTVRHLLLTHGHLDHVFGCAHFQHRFPDAAHGGWQMHPADGPLLDNAVVQGEMFGVRVDAPPPAAHDLAAGDEIALGDAVLRVLHVPGHSPGSVAFYSEADGLVIAGDALFQGSIGRTDLWQGDLDTLLASIRRELLVLPDDTRVFSGHGPMTTVGAERETNPFLNGSGF
ncbi:MBL fold metallo-hydrolase [Rubrivirga sp. IMCC45206]|uniref:MBL fold metallo-hydrolase n=1 Tax=Rubrivirga sp. IMCC45206 TaxID=3391614 RepID=UPI00398FF3B1